MKGGQINSDIEASQSWEKNTFLLKRISMEPTCPSVEVDFSPVSTQQSASLPTFPTHTLRHSFPTFHTDHSHFTPAFILDIDKEKYISNASSYLSLHESKKEELATEKTELFVPKPSKSSSFCCICRTIFEDYLTHVNIPKHQEFLRTSEFAPSITALCNLFSQKEVETTAKAAKGKHTKRIQKAEKPKKRGKKDLDMILNSSVVKLDFSSEGKTKEEILV